MSVLSYYNTFGSTKTTLMLKTKIFTIYNLLFINIKSIFRTVIFFYRTRIQI